MRDADLLEFRAVVAFFKKALKFADALKRQDFSQDFGQSLDRRLEKSLVRPNVVFYDAAAP